MVEVRKLIVAIVTFVAMGLVAPAVALADTTVTVNTTNDTNAASPSTSPDDSSGKISLRSALDYVNASSPAAAVTISVPSGVYTLTATGGSGQTPSTAGRLVVSQNTVPVTIAGAGASSTIIDAGFIDRAFETGKGTTVTISGVTIEDGRTGFEMPHTPGCPEGYYGTGSGGAILDSGTLTLTDDVLTNNVAEGSGGAIEDDGGVDTTLNVSGSTLGTDSALGDDNGNYACEPQASAEPPSNGGAIDESGGSNVTIDTSTISGNQAFMDGGGVAEAGATSDPAGTVTITHSTLSNNTADNTNTGNGNGGGVAGEGQGGTITLFGDLLTGNTAAYGGGVGGSDTNTIINTTIYNNTASTLGGGVDASAGQTSISFSTVNDNSAVGEADGGNIGTSCGSDCGGASPPTVDDSIITGGSPDNCGPYNISSNGYNLFDDNGTDCGATATDLVNTNPNLGPLANNGGPTETEALQPGSPAINAANPDLSGEGPCVSEAESVDQRGVKRPQGPACDIGAYEFMPRGGGGQGKTTTSVSTTVFDARTNQAWAGTETAGASAYDTTNLGGTVEGMAPSGSVTYSLFDNASCSGTAAQTDIKPLNADGSVPNSDPSSALAAGSFSYQVSYGGDANYQASTGPCEPFTVKPGQPDLSLTASPDSNPIDVGEQDTVNDTVTNKGTGDATGVQFTDPAAGFTIDKVTSSQGTCTHSAATVSCDLGTIAAGHSAKLQILVTATSAGTLTLNSRVTLNQTDPTPGNDHATTNIQVVQPVGPAADLAVQVVPSAGQVSVGRTFKYSLVVANHGPDAGNQVSVTDHLPGKVKLVGGYSPSTHCGVTGATFSCGLGTLAKFATRRIKLLVTAEQPGLAIDRAQVTDASPTDPNLKNNTDQAAVTLLAGPRVVIRPLGACHSETSTIHLRAVAYASAGIKQVSIGFNGPGMGEGVATAISPKLTVRKQKIGLPVTGSRLLAGRSYRVVAGVTDKLGRRGHDTAHFTVCSGAPKRGFTG